MGFYLRGLKPSSKEGREFLMPISGWYPMWTFANEVCKDILSDEDYQRGCSNDGHGISMEKLSYFDGKILEY